MIDLKGDDTGMNQETKKLLLEALQLPLKRERP